MQTQKITLLNPFSVSLDKYPFMQVDIKPVYNKSDYKIYKLSNNHYVHTFKNIVFAERTNANKELIENLINDIKPTGEAALYFDYERPKATIVVGIKAAKKLNFKII
jgi:hypothetical protein